jgi:hypothetical protein
MFYLLRKNSLPLLLLLLILSSGLAAQSEFLQQYRQGLIDYQSGYIQGAYHHFREMNKQYPDSVQVLHILGQIDFGREQWKKAAGWYDKIVSKDNTDLHARYYNAICYRETGKFKALLLRKRDWDRAEKNFLFLLDSLDHFKDTSLQYAILQKYRKNYAEAIELAEKQFSSQKSAQTGILLHRYYASFVYNKGFKTFNAWAHKNPGPRTRLYLADAHRLEKDYATADSYYAALLQDSSKTISPVPVYLAYSKSKIEQNQSDSCKYYMVQAIEAIDSDIDAQIYFENIKYILTDNEYKVYLELPDIPARVDFFRRVWIKRNPMPASEMNYRIIEHARRFAYAERNFFYDGFRLPFNNPDRLNILQFPLVFDLNDLFNDKGLVYIRHGDADDRAFAINSGPLNESWLYYARGQLNQKMIFHFWQGDTQSGQNWRMVASIPSGLAESRSNFDHLYSRLMMADPLEAISIRHQMEIASKEYVRIGMNSDQHTWKKDLRSIIFPFYLATFRQDHISTRSEFYFSLTKNDVFHRSAKHEIDDSVTVNFAVFDDNYTKLDKQLLRIPIREIVDSSATMGYWPGQIDYISPPAARLFAINIRTPDDESIGGYKFRFNLGGYNEDSLKMSGIELAHSIRESTTESPFYKSELEIIPNASKIFSRKDNIYTYFEIYNIPQLGGRQTAFSVDYRIRLLQEKQSGLFAKVAQLFKRSQPMVTNLIERSADKPVSFEYLALNLSNQVTGIYELEIKVQINDSQEIETRKINFELK